MKTQAQETQSRAWTEGGSLLVVDDNENNRELLSRRLERQGYRVTLAENGRQALKMLRAEKFELVLLDLIMPGLNGQAVLEQMKADTHLRHIPVVMLSALDELDSVVHCLLLGAEDYLAKPFNPVLLKARIGACLEKNRLREQEQAYLKQLQIERAKSENLLLNVLPRTVAERLKNGQSTIVDSFEDVTVLFADLVGFTSLSVHIAPTEVVQLLDEVFSAFDLLATKHGLEKIKTIGDAYMAVAGLPTPRPDHPEAAAALALDMQSEIGEFNREYRTSLCMRIGINSGPVIAGIIGRNKFIYDLWGDTVNTASRMESHGQPGTIQVTEATYERLKDKFQLKTRGVMEVKGKGQMVTYIVVGRRSD
ncbi:MAG: adenylate/guanylate cyclase domain-containing protein [Limisphaerales bacterium]